MFGGAVLEAEQVARRGLAASRWSRCGRSRAATSAPRPCRSRSGPGCGSRAPRPAGRRRRPGCRGRRTSAPGRGRRPGSAAACAAPSGCRSARPNRSLPSASRNSDGPEAEGDRQPARRQPDRLAGVVGRQVRGALDRADGAGRLAGGHPLGRLGPLLQQRDQLVAVVGGDVERREVQPVLGRGDDAGLVLAAEGVRRRPGRRLGGRRPRWRGPTANAPTTPAAAAPPPRSRAGRCPGVGRRRSRPCQLRTAAVSRDSGSESALTASDELP